jgi:hypothetical protein
MARKNGKDGNEVPPAGRQRGVVVRGRKNLSNKKARE